MGSGWLRLAVAAAVVFTGGCTDSADPEPEPSAVEASPVPISSEAFQWRLAVAPDGRTALLAQSEGFFPQTREASIFEVSRQPDGSWSDPVEVPFVDDTTSDIDPHYSADGSKVWFSSIRDVDGQRRTDVDVWWVERNGDGTWGEPVHGGAVNSPQDDLFPSIAPDGALWVGSDRGGQGFDLWRAPSRGDGGFGAAEPLGPPLNTSGWEFNPALSPSGSLLVFTGLERAGGAGKGDLWMSRLGNAGWSDPEPIEVTASAADEYHPSFSPDGATLFFVRDGDLLQVPAPD